MQVRIEGSGAGRCGDVVVSTECCNLRKIRHGGGGIEVVTDISRGRDTAFDRHCQHAGQIGCSLGTGSAATDNLDIQTVARGAAVIRCEGQRCALKCVGARSGADIITAASDAAVWCSCCKRAVSRGKVIIGVTECNDVCICGSVDRCDDICDGRVSAYVTSEIDCQRQRFRAGHVCHTFRTLRSSTHDDDIKPILGRADEIGSKGHDGRAFCHRTGRIDSVIAINRDATLQRGIGQRCRCCVRRCPGILECGSAGKTN